MKRSIFVSLFIAFLGLMPAVAMAADKAPQPSTTQSAISTTQTVAQSVASVSSDTAKVLNNVIDKSAAGLAEITKKLESGAPKAWSLVVQGTKAKATAGLVIGSILLIWSFIGSVLSYYLFSKIDFCRDTGYINLPFAIMSGMSAFICSLVGSNYMFSSDTWTAFFSPEGYLALQILQKAIGS